VEEPETTARGPRKAMCPVCGGRPRWESLVEGEEERWLGVCRCGRLRAFLPSLPGLEPEDPLRAFLAGPGRPVFAGSPPWARLFLGSVEGAEPVRWRFVGERCRGCGSLARFGMLACPRPWVFAACTLCLACGYVTAGYSRHGGPVEPAEGAAWFPACPAVQRLRDCVHRPFSLLAVGGWRVAHREDAA
jgi:hypothetical protein